MTTQEDKFAKFYSDVLIRTLGTHATVMTTFIAVAGEMTYSNNGQIVVLDKSLRAKLQRKLHISAKTLQRHIKTCADVGAMIRLDADMYMVNPYIASKGAWKHVRRARIDFVDIAASRGITIPTNNEPLPLPGDRII